MESLKNRDLLALLLLIVTLGMLTSASAQITPHQDSYTNSATATTNYGTVGTLGVASSAGSIQTTYIQFDLSSVPAGYTSANIAKATLKLFVNNVAMAGSFNVDYVNGSWSEKTITSSLAPALGNTIASSVPLTTASANNYIEIDVTPAVGEWLSGSQPNDGIALVANSGLSATFDSKENASQSHPAELDIVFTSGGNGTITGVTAGTGLQGGGTTGTVGLSLLKTCSNKQILQWKGSAWTCASAGTGSVSSVALSAPATDFNVSGSPINGAGTLNFAWKVAPTSSNVGNSIVKRDASGNFAAGVVVASTVEAANVTADFMSSATAAQNSALVYAQNTATAGSTTYGVYGETNSNDPAAASVYGFVPFGGSEASGVAGVTQTAYGVGVLGMNTNQSAGPYINGVAIEGLAAGTRSVGVWGIDVSQSGVTLQGPSGVIGAGVWGDTGVQGNFGLAGTAGDGTAGYFENNSATGYAALDAVGDNASSLSFVASNRQTGEFCYVDSAGDLTCSGAKNAVVPIDGGQRHVALSAIESPKNWFEDFGSAQLSAGAAIITLEPQFAQTVNTSLEYHVFLTPNGDCKGLYVTQKTPTSFEVHELGGGASSVSFDYRIVALRRNFENIRMQDHTKNVAMVKSTQAKSADSAGRAKTDISKLLSQPKPVPAMHGIVPKTNK
jgi:hypothetical protein